MKKRVISWLLCLALCLSMLPVAALAEDVQKPEGPAPSMNEPEAEEKETLAPKPEEQPEENPTEEPEQKEPEQEPKQEQEESPIEQPEKEPEAENQPELMTVGNLFIPLAGETPSYTVGDILAERDGAEIGDKGIIGEEIRIRVIISGLDDVQKFGTLLKSISISIDDTLYPVSGGRDGDGPRYVYCDFKPTEEINSVTFSISGTDIVKTRELTFAKCQHPDINNGNTCSQCGAALVAELTAGASSSATYYETLSEALDAAREAAAGSTVKLLADCSLGNYELQRGSFMLDLDGHTLTQLGNPLWVSGTANLTVKNDRSGADYNGRFYLQSKTATLSLTIGSKYAKIMSDSSVGYILGPDMGYKIETNWVTLGQLYSTTIENVTVEQAPFSTSDITVTPEDTYVNRKVTLSVTLDGLTDGSEATCEYSVKTSASSGTTNSEWLGSFRLDTNQTFTTDYTPKVSECTICAQIKYGDFYVIKKLEKKFNTWLIRVLVTVIDATRKWRPVCLRLPT